MLIATLTRRSLYGIIPTMATLEKQQIAVKAVSLAVEKGILKKKPVKNAVLLSPMLIMTIMMKS